jgi:hypothetical protein
MPRVEKRKPRTQEGNHTFHLGVELRRTMQSFTDENWSGFVRQALAQRIQELKKRKAAK